MAEASDDLPGTGRVLEVEPEFSIAPTREEKSITVLAMSSSHGNDDDTDDDIPIKRERQWKSRLNTIPDDRGNSSQAVSKTETAAANVFPHLKKAMTSEDAEVLCHHTSTGARVLEELERCLSSHEGYTDSSRISSVNALQRRANTSQTVIGVVGGTGHGKSSLINALIGEKKLVPTNCFRACTAVVTELSWNSSNDPDHRYIAEIEFVTADDWDRELGHLIYDLISSGDLSSEEKLKDSDAHIAWAKIKAVYPELNMQSIRKIKPNTLADDPAIKGLLGTTKTVHKRTASELHDGIQNYVGSGKKTSLPPFGERKENTQKMEFWPLIKVVRIYTKADALSTGAVIVDLPGVKDSNAARAAVAEKYIEKCDALWVVSMITRAVDDQTAHELLGERFRQQLKLDGNYLNVTFICSKTDDINVDEAADVFGLSQMLQELSDAKVTCSKLNNTLRLEKVRMRKEAVSAFVDEIDDHISRYDALSNDLAKGKSVTLPKILPQKRGQADTGRHNKRRRVEAVTSQDAQSTSAEDLWADLEKGMPKPSADNHSAQQDIQSMTEYLKSQKRAAMDEKRRLQERIDDGKERITDLENEISELQEQLEVTCVSRRNDASSREIRIQFALGLRELDEHEAQRNDPNNFDPEIEQRDYKEVERSLPVYCISSRAYQLLDGKELVKGFRDMDDTQIPQLRTHTKNSTELTRIRNAKSFLNDLIQILNSLYMWSSITAAELYLTDEEKGAEMGFVRKQAEELGKRLQVATEQFSQQIKEILEVLFKYFRAAAAHASKCAVDVARQWPSQKRGDKGLSCAAYKATLRRNGVFSGRSGPRNFNEDLAAPLLQQLSNQWENTFTKKIPDALVAHIKTCQRHQDHTHNLVKNQIREKFAFNGITNVLQDQDDKRIVGLSNKINSLASEITTIQRRANRDFTPAIQQRLKPKYKLYSKDKGPGVFTRIRDGIEAEIGKRGVFSGSCKLPKSQLSLIPEMIQEDLQIYIDIMQAEMIADYRNVILGADASGEAKVVRQRVHELLEEVDILFQ